MRSDVPDNSVAALERQIRDVEAEIKRAEVNQAEAGGDAEGLRFWRTKEQQLRAEEQLLREEKARKEALQQGHVLGSETAQQQLQAIFDYIQEQNKEKPAVSISSIKTDTWLEVQSTAKLSIRIIGDLSASAPKETVTALGWDDRNERAQSDRYMPHLRQIISLGSMSTDWVDAANRHPQLLSYDGLETLGRNFRGTTDVLVADRAAIRARQPGRGMRLLFELKKKLADRDVIQAQASLLLANLHSPELRPMLVLTDLSDEWHLLWLDSATINVHAFTSRGQAVGFIEDFLAGCIDEIQGVEPNAVKVARRCKIDGRLAATSGAADSTAFGDQMQSLEGLVAPSELMQMRADRLVRLLESSPFAPSWRPVPAGMYA